MSREPMRRTIRGGRPYFFADPAIDKILNMVVVLSSEVWTLRERLAAFEMIEVRQGGLAAGEIDAFDFSPEQEAKLAGERKEFIDSVFRILQEHAEEARGRLARATQTSSARATPKAASWAEPARPARGGSRAKPARKPAKRRR
jgi:hypothetical protein